MIFLDLEGLILVSFFEKLFKTTHTLRLHNLEEKKTLKQNSILPTKIMLEQHAISSEIFFSEASFY